MDRDMKRREEPASASVGRESASAAGPDSMPRDSWRLPALSLLVFGILAGAIAPWMGWAFAEADLSARPGAASLSPRIWTSLQLYLVLCASAGLPAALLAGRLRRRGVAWTRALGLARVPKPGSCLLSWMRGAVGGAALIALLVTMLFVGGWLGRTPESPDPRVVLLVALALAVAALYEELLFRGFGFWAMERLGGPLVATATTSLLFAWAHSNNSGSGLLGLVNTALAGALLGWLRSTRGHLWSAWGLHFGWNLTLGILFGATTSGFGFAGRFARAELTARGEAQPLLSGGDYGPEASLVLTILLAGWLLLVIRRARAATSNQLT